MRRAFSALALTTALTGSMLGFESATVNPSLVVTHEVDPNVAAGLLDLGDAALQGAIVKQPPAIQARNAAVVKITSGAMQGSGFNIAYEDITYTVTAGHVEGGVEPRFPCAEQQIISHTKSPDNVSAFDISGRAGMFSGTLESLQYGKPDIGMFRLDSQHTNDLPLMHVQPEAKPLATGQLLYNTDEQPFFDGSARNPFSTGSPEGTPNQMVGVVLGRVASASNIYVYAVLGLKAYSGDPEVIPGGSGGPWENSDDVVIGESSAFAIMSAQDIKDAFGVTVLGESQPDMYVTYVQVIGMNTLKPLIQRMQAQNTC